MSGYAGAGIYHGTWTNWSEGRVRGATLTLSYRDGSLLTAFLAVFVAASGTAVWRIISYAIHQVRTSPHSQDGLFHQQQAILRNTGSPDTAAWQFAQVIYAWRKIARKPFWRSFPMLLLAMGTIVAFTVAGIFSSEVTKATGSDVLIRSTNCGNWTGPGLNNAALLHKALNDTVTASNYARACYGASSALQCSQFVTQQLPYITIQNTTCPFEQGLCVYGATAAFTMDTGYMSSLSHLGINTREDESVTYRRRTTCAALEDENYITSFNYTDAINMTDILGQSFQGDPGDVIDFYNFGNTTNNIYYAPRTDQGNNATYWYNRHASAVGFGYQLISTEYNPDMSSESWTPTPALHRNDADVNIMFLSANSILYEGVVNDPIFSAHFEYGNTSETAYYWSDFYVSPLACIDQHVFCNPNNGKCTDLQSFFHAVNDATASLDLNAVQSMIVGTMGPDLALQTMDANIGGRGPAALRAQESVSGLVSEPLPPNQWQIEVESWFTTGLAKLQRSTVEFAAGSANILDPNATNIIRPTDTVGTMLCANQKVAADGTTANFSVLGIIMILVCGMVLILVNIGMDTVVGYFQKRRAPDHRKRLQWILDGKLQLQRLAYEEAGLGTWSNCAATVPTTLAGEKFGLPRKIDAQHPSLSKAALSHEMKQLASKIAVRDYADKGPDHAYDSLIRERESGDETESEWGTSEFAGSLNEELSRIATVYTGDGGRLH